MVEKIDTYTKFKASMLEPDFRAFMEDRGSLRKAWHCAGSLFHLHDWVYAAQKASQVCEFFVYNFRTHYDALKAIRIATMGHGEIIRDKSSNLVFTGRVYLYHEDELSYQDMAALIQLFESKECNVRFRGQKYVSDEWKHRLLNP